MISAVVAATLVRSRNYHDLDLATRGTDRGGEIVKSFENKSLRDQVGNAPSGCRCGTEEGLWAELLPITSPTV